MAIVSLLSFLSIAIFRVCVCFFFICLFVRLFWSFSFIIQMKAINYIGYRSNMASNRVLNRFSFGTRNRWLHLNDSSVYRVLCHLNLHFYWVNSVMRLSEFARLSRVLCALHAYNHFFYSSAHHHISNGGVKWSRRFHYIHYGTYAEHKINIPIWIKLFVSAPLTPQHVWYVRGLTFTRIITIYHHCCIIVIIFGIHTTQSGGA